MLTSYLFYVGALAKPYVVAVQDGQTNLYDKTFEALSRLPHMSFDFVVLNDKDLYTICESGGCDFAIVTGTAFQCLQLATGASATNTVVQYQKASKIAPYIRVAGSMIVPAASKLFEIPDLSDKVAGVTSLLAVTGYAGQVQFLLEHGFNLFQLASKIVQTNTSLQAMKLLDQGQVDFVFVHSQAFTPAYRVIEGMMSDDSPCPHTTRSYSTPLFISISQVPFQVRTDVSTSLMAHNVTSGTTYAWTSPGEYGSTRVAMTAANLIDSKTNSRLLAEELLAGHVAESGG